MTNEELIVAMKLDMERRGLLPNSIAKRTMCLRAFMRWLGEEGSILTADRAAVNAFLDSRRTRTGQAIESRTRYIWIAHFHAFYKFAQAEEIRADDPTERIVRPKLRRSLPRPAASEDIRRLLETAGPMETCWVLLAGKQGLRCQEIAGLRREDVLDTERLIRITHGKGGKERMLPLHPDVLAGLRALPMPRAGYVFTRPRGGKYSPNWLSACFNAFLKSALGDDRPTAHQFRHWFGTHIYASTHDIRVTQELLGHSNPATTAIYTAFSSRDASVAVNELSFGDVDLPDDDDLPDEAA